MGVRRGYIVSLKSILSNLKQSGKSNPVRGGGLTGFVGGGNEGKEETSFRFENN
jgi:hypothetical protein